MEQRVIGTRLPKVDAPERVTGKAAFGADLHLPGMLWARIVRSPYPHARIKKIDTSKALALSGVKAVITAADLPPLAKGATAPLVGEMSIDLTAIREIALASDKVRYHAQSVAAVAAVDPFTAEEAARLVEVEYEELPVVEDVLQAMRPDAPLVHEDLYTVDEATRQKSTHPSNIAAHMVYSRGDVEAGFRAADVVIERTYRTQMVHQGYLEPQACAARVEPDGKITVWTSTQGVFTVRTQLVELLGLPASRIKVVPMEIGGGFGGKALALFEPIVAVLAQKTGRPVKLVLSREEVLRATGPGAPAVITVKAGATRDGKLTAVSTVMRYDAGAFPGSPVGRGILVGLAPYKLENMRAEGFDVVTNKPRVQAYRAPGGTPAAFAVEALMDELAEAIGMDPLEFRLRNAADQGDLLPLGMPLNRVGLKTMLAQVKTHPCWTTPLHGPNRGRGFALGYWIGGTFTSSAEVRINPDATASVFVGTVDLTGTRTTIVQMVAEELHLSPSDISITVGDTDTAPYADLSGGSRITYTMSAAVYQACQDALAQLKERAADKLKVSPADVEYGERRFWARGEPQKTVTLKELARESIAWGKGPIIGKGSTTRMQPAHAYAAHVADVEVDPETGKVKVLRYTCFQDVGRAINPVQVEGQMQGGAVQGIGWALTEEYVFERGVLKNANLLDYRCPVALDLPMIDTVIVEVPASEGPYGLRGTGEVPIVPPGAALANAIYRATGVRLYELPMTPERVFWALRAHQETGAEQMAAAD
ncbi:MAG: xanthine dehydrogenase family protein molybdopterin-binding subunit [Candidatus Binatia bacterium]|nr:xanthine dehydrogenase family protein molybdopterin-binding subunit [Candidatus Binatia bacterium]